MTEIMYLRTVPEQHEIDFHRLEQMAIENIRRAKINDDLAGKLEAWATNLQKREALLDGREAEVAMREADVLKASLELKRWRQSKLAMERRRNGGRFTQRTTSGATEPPSGSTAA